MLDGKVVSKAEDVPSTTEAAEPEPAEFQVTELKTPEETPLVAESPTPVKEVPVDAEPVIATPLIFDVPEHAVEPVVTEEAPAVDSIESVDKPEPPAPEVAEQEDPVPAVSGPIVGPAAEEGFVPDPLRPDVPAPEPVSEPQESETVHLSVLSEKPSLEETPPTIPEPVEAVQDIPAPDVPQEETKQVEGSWTPSYSVSSQGGGLDTAPPADEEIVEPTPAPEPPVEESATEFESTPAPKIVTSAEVCAFMFHLPHGKLTSFLFRNLLFPNRRRLPLSMSKVPAPVSSLRP